MILNNILQDVWQETSEFMAIGCIKSYKFLINLIRFINLFDKVLSMAH